MALVGNLVRPGTFSKTYNDLCGENNLPTLSLNSFIPPSKAKLQNSGFDPCKIISNILQSPDEFSSNDVQHSSTIRESPSSYHSIVNEIENENEEVPNDPLAINAVSLLSANTNTRGSLDAQPVGSATEPTAQTAPNDPLTTNALSLSVNGNSHDSLTSQTVDSTTETATLLIPPVSNMIEMSDNSQRCENLSSQTNIPNARCNLQSGDLNTETATPLVVPLADMNESPIHALEGESHDSLIPITNARCIKGFKIKQTWSNNPKSILRGVKDKKILFTDNGRIISDIKIIEKYLQSNPNPKITSTSPTDFNQLLETNGLDSHL